MEYDDEDQLGEDEEMDDEESKVTLESNVYSRLLDTWAW